MTAPLQTGLPRREVLGILAGTIALALLPLGMHDVYLRHLVIMSFIYAMVACSWDITLGYAGIFNFGHVALFGIGLYAYGLLTKLLGVEPWLALVAGGLAASAAAALITLPILRLRGVYVVLVTFAFGQLVMQIVISQSDITGGNQGLVRIPTFPLGAYNLLRDGKLAYYFIALALLVVTIVCLRIFVRSRTGLAVRALRDNEEYAVSRGISEAQQRLITMVFSAFFTGLAGALYGGYFRNASTDVFGPSLTTLILSIVLLGGSSTIYGPLVAAVLLVFGGEVMASLGPWRPILIGFLIIAVVLVWPGGLAAGLRAGSARFGRGRGAALSKAPPLPAAASEAKNG